MAEEQSSPEAGNGAPRVVEAELRPIWPAPPSPEAISRRRWALAARIAATVGGLLFFFAAWTPWATALTSGDLAKGPSSPSYIYSLTAAELGAPPLASLTDPASAFAYWSLITILGALLTPLLWQRTRPWLVWVAATLYALWAVACALVLAQTDALLFQTVPSLTHAANGPYTTTLQPYGMRLAIYAASPAFGLYLATLALLAALVALVLAALALRASPPVFRKRAPMAHGEVEPSEEAGASRKRRSLPGVGAVSGGLLLWAWGFFLLPWATLNCEQAPLLFGQCQGLPVASALQAGLLATRNIFDPASAPYAISGLLLGGAGLAFVTVWRREITRTLCAWLSAWVVFALACALIAINGAQLVVHNAASIGVPTGDWRGSLGTLIVFLGLLLVVIGLTPLWAIAIRSAPRRDLPTN
jgi:hypothetical protein